MESRSKIRRHAKDRTGVKSRRHAQTNTGRHRRLRLETLEDRRLLAVLWERIEPLGSLIFEAEKAGQIGGVTGDTTTAFLEADQTLTAVAAPADDLAILTLAVRDPDNLVLASATAAGPGETVDIQTVGIMVDGNYTVEVSGDIATRYELSLFRNATVEVFDTDDGSEQDATGSFIPLGSGRFGIVGEFTLSEVPEPERPIVWGIQPNTGQILKIDPQTGTILGSFSAPDALSPAHRVNGLSIAEDGDSLLYVNGGTNGNNLYRLDPDDGTVLSVEFLPTSGSPALRGGLSFESEGPDWIFAIDDGAPVDRQAGFGGPLTDWTPSGVAFPGALGGDDNGRLFVLRLNEIQEFSTTVANTQLNAFPLPPGAVGGALGLAFDGVDLYLSDAQGNLLTLDPDTGAVLNQVTVAGGFLSGLGADFVGGFVEEDFRLLGGTGTATLVELQTDPVAEILIGSAGFNPGLDVDPTSGLLYGANDHLRIINSADGSFTTIGPIHSASTPLILMKSIAFAPGGTLYGSGVDNVLYTIDKTTAFATRVGTNAAWGIDFAPDGTMYGAATSLQIIDPATANVISTVGALSSIVLDIDFAPDGLIYGLNFATSELISIDPADASQSLVGTYQSDLWGLASEVITSPTTARITPDVGEDPSDPAQSAQTLRNLAAGMNVGTSSYGDPGERANPPTVPTVRAQRSAAGELLVNGSFETGNFTGWTTVTTATPFRPWAVTGGGLGGGFGMSTTQPQDGTFVAWNGFDGRGPMEFQLYQDVTIAPGATATLNWMDRVQWNFFAPNPQPRLYDVEIRDPTTNAVLDTVFSFSTGATSGLGDTGWQSHSVDVSSFAGRTVRVFFREQIPQSATGPGQIEFDAISLTESVVAEPDVDEYLLDLTGKAGQPIDIAFAADTIEAAGELDLAILISESDTSSAPVAQLQATGLFDSITVINTITSTPTLADLEPFETILAYTNLAPSNAVALGDVLADYVDAGGQLSIATYGFSTPWDIRGRITTPGYAPLTNEGVKGGVSGSLIATVPDDPIFDGIDLNAVTYFLNGNFAHPGIDAGAMLLATDGAGHNMIARNAAGDVVGLNFYPRGTAAPNNQELFNLIGNSLVRSGFGEVTLELLDTDGTTVLATGVPGATNFDLGILDFVVPADGVYTVRVSSEQPGTYGIVVTDSLVFDTESNDDPGSGSLRSLDATGAALGFLGSETVAARLFAVDFSTDDIVEFDPATGAELNRFALPEPASGGPDALAFDGLSLFYAEGPQFGGSGILYELDPDTGAILDADPFGTIGLNPSVDGLGVYGGRVIASDTTTGQIQFVDTASDVVVGSITSPVTIRGGLTGAGSRGSIFANNFFAPATIYELDAATGAVLNQFPAPSGANATGLAYVDGVLYTGQTDGSVNALDPDTGVVLGGFVTAGQFSALGGDDPSGIAPFFASISAPVTAENAILDYDQAPSGSAKAQMSIIHPAVTQLEHWIVVADDPALHETPRGVGLDGVVEMLIGRPDLGGAVRCTGSLLTTGSHILTAAHCVADSLGNPSASFIDVTFELPTGDVTVTSSTFFVHPDWNGDFLNGYDAAVIELPSQAPAAADRYDIYRGGGEIGEVHQKVGYGRSGTGNTGSVLAGGTKRDGNNKYDSLADIFDGFFFVPGSVTPGSQLAFDFDNGLPINDAFGFWFGINDIGLGNAEINSAPGDSGGPTFIDGLVAGITSYGFGFNGFPDVIPGTNSSFGEMSVDTRVSFVADWIDSIALDPMLVGPVVVGIDPEAGDTDDLDITQIHIEFDEPLDPATAQDAGNYELVEAGTDGAFGTGDDVVIAVTPSYDGLVVVTLDIDAAVAPLSVGAYRLTIVGEDSIKDVDGNPLNSRSGPGGGSNEVHHFTVVPPEGGDHYTLTAKAGQAVGLSTQTPFDSQASGLNALDPALVVYDSTGAILAFDADSADGKNASLVFVAPANGVYTVGVLAETDGAGEYVLSVNWAPVIEGLALSADEIFESESVSLAGSYSDQNLGDSHTVVVDWDDPNNSADSTFAVSAINTLSVGDMFGSSTDGAVLTITSVDLLTGEVGFVVTDHQYLDDGLAPGNGTAADRSSVTVTVTDDGELVAAPPIQELIVNGDFETGDFTGWTVSSTASGNWLINDGTLDPLGPGTPLPPISGSFDAVSVESGPAVATLSEPIVVPTSVSSAVLSWSDRIRNFAGQGFADPGQEWRVLVLNNGGGLIQEVFSTNPGDPTQQTGPNHRSFDLTSLFQSLAGQTVRISFEQQSQFFFFNATLDDVSLLINASPSVLVKNVAPALELDPVAMINENDAASLLGSITDPGLLDEHEVIVDWDDPNDTAPSTFAIAATAMLTVGDTFASTTDTAVLEITSIDLSTGKVGFLVEHVYLDDGPAPGNGTPADTSKISVTVTDDDVLNFPDFSDITGLTLNGGAFTPTTADGTVLRLASTNTSFDVGSAFSHVPVNAADGFSTEFTFRITDPGGVTDGTEPGADGFTFTLQTLGPGALGIAGGDLGFGGLAPSIAVEFDTWQNAWDPSTNHLGVDVNGSVLSLVTVDEPTNKWDNGGLYFVWIDYDGADLEVRVSTTGVRPASPNLAVAIDIAGILGQNTAFAGFTAATGGAFGNHDIVNWRLVDLALAQTTVLVQNVDPEITSVVVSATMDNKAMPGDNVTLAATFTDIGLLDRHEVTIDWDDATPDSVFEVDATADLTVGDTFLSSSGDGAVLTITDVIATTGEVSFTVASHQFATGGIFEVALTIEDDDTGADADGTIAWVTGVRLNDGELQIVGSNGDDRITVNKQGNGLIKVHADFLLTGNFETFVTAEVQHILAYLCSGDDHMTIAGNIVIPAIIHGKEGNDHINAGGGPTVIDGGDGDDHLNGGSGRDILIGGLGADRLVGSAGDDILIGGTTSYDRNDDALMALLEEWNSERGYPERVENIRTGSGPVLDGTGIKLEKGLTVFDDGDLDVLTGSSGRDWFFFDPDEDRVNDQKVNEETD